MRISDWSSDVCSSDLFDGEFQVLSWRPVGTQHLKLELGLPGVHLQAIEFGGWTGTPPASRVRVAYRLTPDEYRGGSAVQLIVVHREPADWPKREHQARIRAPARSAERRAGQEGFSTRRSRWSQYDKKKKQQKGKK